MPGLSTNRRRFATTHISLPSYMTIALLPTGTTKTTIIFSLTRKVKNSSVRVEPSTKIWKRWTSTTTLQLLNTWRKGNTQRAWTHHTSRSNGSPVLENTSYKKGALGWSTLKVILSG